MFKLTLYYLSIGLIPWSVSFLAVSTQLTSFLRVIGTVFLCIAVITALIGLIDSLNEKHLQ